MDIPYRQFSDELVNIISQITSSHFVALDLEFSGISSRRNRACDRKLTLQEVYEQTKEAATQYQILQVGLTVVHENISRGIESYQSSLRQALCDSDIHGSVWKNGGLG